MPHGFLVSHQVLEPADEIPQLETPLEAAERRRRGTLETEEEWGAKFAHVDEMELWEKDRKRSAKPPLGRRWKDHNWSYEKASVQMEHSKPGIDPGIDARTGKKRGASLGRPEKGRTGSAAHDNILLSDEVFDVGVGPGGRRPEYGSVSSMDGDEVVYPGSSRWETFLDLRELYSAC